MESFHSSLTALYILSIESQLLVNFINSCRMSLHLPYSENPETNKADDHSFRHGGEVLNGSPVEISVGIFDKSKQVFESPFLIGSVDALFTESILLEFPIILLADGSI